MLLLLLLGASLAGNARGQAVTEFPIPTAGSGPSGIAAGADGNLWFTENTGNQIGRITTAGFVTEFPIPSADSSPLNIAAGSDGNLWFVEVHANQIGRITTAGVITEFPISTGDYPIGIAAGSDGNLWFTQCCVNQIGRITTAGVISEFPIPADAGFLIGIAAGPDGNLWASDAASQIDRITTAGVVTEFPISTGQGDIENIAAGPDGNLWFTDTENSKIGRITTAGVITVFSVPPTHGLIRGIAAGSDGNLWFTELAGSPAANNIGRITTAGFVTEFPILTFPAGLSGIAAGPDGKLWFEEGAANRIGRMTPPPATPQPMEVDARIVTGGSSNANGVLEPGETVQVDPAWKNTLTIPQTFTGTASNLMGPAGTYTIDDSSADYGTVSAGAAGDCNTPSGDCYLMTVSGTRPATHWDATFTENLSPNSLTEIWTLHVGGSFTDVSTDVVADPYYPSIETVLHKQISVGCQDGTVFCPTDSTTRQEMAVFLLKASQGSSYDAPNCAGIFSDVPCTPGVGFPDWIETLYRYGITAGCQLPDNPLMYCPTRDVLRCEMAVFLLKAAHGFGYKPPACAGIFGDVPCTPGVGFSDWIEDIYNGGITAGCQAPGDPLMYCPDRGVLRQEMAVFLVKAFGLQLYGP